LTGDGKLRIVAAVEKISCHGTVWLMEQLIISGILTVQQAAVAYEQMKAAHRRLPWDEEVAQQLRAHGL
jgi:hypothetical protein